MIQFEPLDSISYESIRYTMLKYEESPLGVVNLAAYADSAGKATIGTGINLTVDANLIYTLKEITGLTTIPTAYFNDIKSIVNQDWTGNSTGLRTALDTKMFTYFPSTPTFEFSGETNAHTVFNEIMPTYEGNVDSWLALIPQSYEREALVSLAWNNAGSLLGTNLKYAISNDNRAEAWFEIRYDSNGNNLSGIAKRRDYESEMFGLYKDQSQVTDKEALDVYKMLERHDTAIGTYETLYSSQISAANSSYDAYDTLRTHQVQTLAESLAPAHDHLIDIYASGPIAHGASIDNIWVDYTPLPGPLYGSPIVETDSYSGTSGNDLIFSGNGADSLSGGNGDDTIVINGTGIKTIDGGSGNDTINFSGYFPSSYYLTVDLSQGMYADSYNDHPYLASSIENIVGRQNSDFTKPYNGFDLLIGDTHNNIIDGKGGRDDLTGGGGADTFIWGANYYNWMHITDGSSNDRIQLVDMDTSDLAGNYWIDDFGYLQLDIWQKSEAYDPRYPGGYTPSSVALWIDTHVGDAPIFINPNGSTVSYTSFLVNVNTWDPGYGGNGSGGGGWGGVRSDDSQGATSPTPVSPPSSPPWTPPVPPAPGDPPLVAPTLPYIPPQGIGNPDLPALQAPADVPYGPGYCPAFIGPVGSTYSPLVIDLGNDGLTLTSLSSQPVYWDVDNDGMREATAWFGAAEGILTMDWNGNGVVDNHSELFGTKTVDGFTKLAELDSNHDGIINSSDTEFANLKVWIDVNQDGISSPSELFSLIDVDVQSISLSASSIATVISGNTVNWESTVTMTDTSTRNIYDAWLESDNQNTIYDGFVPLNPDVLYLPFLRGFGEVKDSDIQMSFDNSLFIQVANLSLMTKEDVLDPSKNFDNLFHDMLYKWDGLADRPNELNSTFENDRKVSFVADISGQGDLPVWLGVGQAEAFRNDGLWEHLNTYYTGTFLYQTVFHDLFTGSTPHYDTYSGTIQGATGLSSTVLAGIETFINGTDDPGYGWSLVVRTVEEAIGIDNLTYTDYNLLDTAIHSSDPTLDLSAVKDLISGVPNNIVGTSGDDSLVGTFADDHLDGQGGNDTLQGGHGDDHLYAQTGDDTYIGGAGDDTLDEMYGSGNDTYNYNFGHDIVINEIYGTDKIVLDAGIALGDVTIERVNPYDPSSLLLNGLSDLVIHVANHGDIAISNQYNYYGSVQGIETLQFHDLSTIDLTVLESTIYGTSGNDMLTGIDHSYYLRDTIDAGDGNDTLNGGLGNNALYGSLGDDTYVVGQGVDWIQEGTGTDQVVFNNTYDPDLFTFKFNELIDPYDTTTQALQIYYEGHLKAVIDQEFGYGSTYFVEKVSVDGVHDFDIASMNWDQHGTEGNDSLYAIQTDAIIHNSVYGNGGDDVLTGSVKDDDLHGGDSADVLHGNDGNDHVYGDAGDDNLSGEYGNDVLYGGNGTDSLSGGSGADAFVFEAATAFNNVDTIWDFNTGQNDVLDIKDLLTDYVPGTSDISDFVTLGTSGSSTTVSVDRDGAGSTYTSHQVATLSYVTGLDVHDMLTNHNLVAA